MTGEDHDTPLIPPAASGEEEKPLRTGRVVYRQLGVLGSFRASVCIDFDRKVLSHGAVEIPFSRLRVVEVRVGVFGASDGERWIWFDVEDYRDGTGPLSLPEGTFSETFVADCDDLRLAVRYETAVGNGDSFPDCFDFRTIVRVDYGSIFLGLVGVGIFFTYYQRHLEHLLDVPALKGFLVALAASVVWLYVWRLTTRIRFDAVGVTTRRLWFVRSTPWSAIAGIRQQGLELEIEGPRRLSLNLDLLRVGRAPLLIRRGLRPAITPLGAMFLMWLRERAVEKPERPVFGTKRERLLSRLWVVAMLAANATMFLISRPPILSKDPEQIYLQRLWDLGARTPETLDSWRESTRLFTSLFLHADIVHITFNMLVLAAVAPWLGRIFGWLRGTLLYLGSGVLGNLLAQISVMGTDQPPIAVGASTAILGVIGCLLGAIYRRPLSVPLAARARFRWAIPVMVLLTIGMGLTVHFIDNGAHVGGFVAGCVLAFLIPPKRVDLLADKRGQEESGSSTSIKGPPELP